MSLPPNIETVVTFTHPKPAGGHAVITVDHLGIAQVDQWGQYAVYQDGAFVGDFELGDIVGQPAKRSESVPVTQEELIGYAKEILEEDTLLETPGTRLITFNETGPDGPQLPPPLVATETGMALLRAISEHAQQHLPVPGGVTMNPDVSGGCIDGADITFTVTALES